MPYIISYLRKDKNAITELGKHDTIEKVPENEAMPWVSRIVAVPEKDSQVRTLFFSGKSSWRKVLNLILKE